LWRKTLARPGSGPVAGRRGLPATRGQDRQRDRLAHGRALFALEPLLDHHRAFPVVMVEHLAMQAGNALVGFDVALRVDGLDRAILEAGLAGVAAFAVALQPLKRAQPRGNRQRRAQRTQVAAEESLD